MRYLEEMTMAEKPKSSTTKKSVTSVISEDIWDIDSKPPHPTLKVDTRKHAQPAIGKPKSGLPTPGRPEPSIKKVKPSPTPTPATPRPMQKPVATTPSAKGTPTPTPKPSPAAPSPEFARLVKRYGGLKDRIKEMENLGINMDEVIDAFKAAQPLLKKKEFSTADKLAKDIEDRLKKTHRTYQQLVSLNETLDLRMTQAREMGLELADIEVIKGEAESSREAGDLMRAQEQTSFCIDTIEAAQKEAAKKLLDKVSVIIRDASYFIDSTRPADLLNQGNIALTKKQYYKAYNLFRGSQDELLKVQKRYQSVIEKVKKFSTTVDVATGLGFKIQNSDAIIEKGQSLLKEGRADLALRYIDDELHAIETEVEKYGTKRAERACTDVKNLKAKVAEARKVKADTNQFEIELKKAEALLSVKPTMGQLDEATKIIDDVSLKLDGMIKKAMEEVKQIERLESLLPTLLDQLIEASESYDVHKLEKLYANAKSCRDIGNIVGALDYTSQFSELLDEIKVSSYPQISLELGAEALEPEIWSRLMCQMENIGATTAIDINLNLSGPITIKRVRPIDSLKIGKKASFEIGAVLNGRGRLPVDVELRYQRKNDKKTYVYNEEIWLLVGMGTKGSPTKMQISPIYTCTKCQKSIREDDILVKCDCSSPYHSHCAKQAQSCPSCASKVSEMTPVVRSIKKPRPGELEEVGAVEESKPSPDHGTGVAEELDLDGEWL